MGCNCNKQAGKPATPAARAQAAARGNSSLTAAAIRDAQAQARATMRANIPTRGKTQSFALSSNDGKTQVFGSRLEAEAANVLSGYRGRVRPITLPPY